MPTPPANSDATKTVSRRSFWPLIIGVALLILILGASAYFLTPKAEKPTVVTEPVTRGDIRKVVAATGKVVPNFEVEIKAKGSGKILKLPYDVSDYVPQGALLAQLDPIDENRAVQQVQASVAGLDSRTAETRVNLQVARQTLQTDIARAKADIQAAQARETDAQTKANRLSVLVKNRYISQEEYETGLTTVAQAKTDFQNAKIRLQELQTQNYGLGAQAEQVENAAAQAQAQRVALASSQQRLSETRIYAPIAGVVTTRLGQIGQIVSSGISNVGGGTAIMTLADLSHIYVLASVDESDIGQVKVGQTVDITADSFPGQTFSGKVVRISPKGIVTTNVVTFEVKIEVQGDNSRLLMPEMTANVEILVAQKKQALKVPTEVITLGRNGESMVRVLGKDGEIQRRPVVTGLSNGTDTEIINGLSEQEAIVSTQGSERSKWRKTGETSGNNRRGQMMMMRSVGGGGGRR
ncbi:efflux RND transporter periplasmic adaptor subunit [Vampirovibrio sp.]|uniref:efflux RND transporter periplasmic adaptor subunit n=1 Tax=Vampirovibrio sp. TaxID=2717857 RepID=UPI0035938F9A